MASNSWKQYGGQSKSDEYNIINASTVIADQFVSRSVKTGSYFLSGSLEVSNDISAGFNIIAGQTLCTQQNLFVNEDIYSNKKIYFGAGTEFINSGTKFPILASDNSNVFIYGDASFVAINSLSSDATFQINGTDDETKNIFVVESVNNSLRNIIGQNKNNRGIAIKVNDSSSNILFYNDTSTNIVNEPNANISYISNGTLMQNTIDDYTSTGVLKLSSTGKILHSSDIFQIDNSGGRIYMDNSGFVLDSSGAIVLNAYGIVVEASGGNLLFDVSGNYLVKNNDTHVSVNGNAVDISSNNITLSSTNGNIGLDSSGGKIDVISDSANFYSQVKMLSANQDSSDNVFNETLTVFDTSNNVYLENVYDISGILTGSAITGVSKDASSNTFIHLTSRNTKQGAAYGGGVYPLDTSRSMNTIGINDNSGNYVMNQTIVSNKDSAKYLSTLGINTFAPKTNEYVVDVNGPMRISNGEIHNVATSNFEIRSVSFSKNNLQYGIACGTPSKLDDLPTNSPSFSQTLLYTKNGGIEWAEADVYNSTTLDDLLVNFNSGCLYDANYGIIGGNFSYLYYTNNGGSNWYRMQYYESGSDLFTDNTYRDTNSAVIVSYNSNLRVYIAYKYNDPDGDPVDTFTKQIRYFDIPIASLSTVLNGDTYKISTFNEISISSDINISYGTNSANYLYYVGNGIMKIQISDSTITYTVNTTSTYSHIYAYDDNFVVAVGDNIISYTNDGTTWTNIAIDTNTSFGSNIILNHVHIYDTNNISVVGNNGVFAYTTSGPAGSNWQLVPNTILNSSGTAHLINDSQNTLKTVHMIDQNTLIISNVLNKSSNTTDDSNDIVGKSKLLYVFLPNLYFKLENNLLDICGNMMISGNIQTYDGYIGIGKAPSALTALDISANNAIQLPIGNNSQRPVSDNSGDSYKGLLRYNNEIDQFEGYGGGDIWGPLGGTDANGDLEIENDLTVNGTAYIHSISGSFGTNTQVQFQTEFVAPSAVITIAEITDIKISGDTFVNDISANDISANTIQATNLHIVNPITSETIVNISTTNYDEVKVEDDMTINGRFFVNEITNSGMTNTEYITISKDLTVGERAFLSDLSVNLNLDVLGTSNMGDVNTNNLSTAGHNTISKDLTVGERAFLSDLYVNLNIEVLGATILRSDLSLNNRLYVGDNATIAGDLSINSSLYVSGDVSWNSANIANDSIPQSAIIGGVGSDTFTNDVSMNKGLYVGKNILINAEEIEYFSINTLPTTFTGSFPRAQTTSRLTYTQTVSSYTGSDWWKNGDYTIVGTSNEGVSYDGGNNGSSTSNPENMFNTRTYGSGDAGSYWITARSVINPLSYLDADGNSQTLTATTHMEWVSIQFPFDFNITSFSFFQGSGIPKYADVLVEYPDGNLYLIHTATVNTSNDRWQTKSVSIPSHDYYGSKLYFSFRDEGTAFGVRNFELASLKINGTVKVVDTLLVGFETNHLSIFNGDISLNGDLYAAGSGVIDGDISLNHRLYVGNNATIAGDLSINSSLYVSGDVSWNSANIADNSIPQSAIIGGVGSNDFSGLVSMADDLSVNNRLFVGNNATIAGDLSINSSLYVSGDVSWNSANIANDSIPQSAIIGGVGSNTMTGVVSMDSDLDLNGRLFVGGDVSLNGRLFVDNDITLNGITTVNRGVAGEYSSNVSNFPSDLVSFSLVQYTLGETKTNTSGEVLVLGDYSWSTTTYGDGNNNMKLTYQLRGYTGSSYSYVVNNGVGSGTVNQITYAEDSSSNVLITEGTGSQHWIRLTAPRFMVVGKLRFATSTGNDLNKVPKNVYIVGTDEYGDKRLLGSKLEADLMYQTTYYIDLLDTPVSDVYFIYQTRGNYNAVEFLDFQYHDVVLQETQEVAGLISDAISTFNKTVTINDDLYVNGNSYTTGTATSSDDRLKHNEESIINALDTIRKLQPKHYYKTKELYDANHSFEIDGSGNIIDASGNMIHLPKEDGFIAQEVENIPELNFAVHIGSETTPYALNYNSIFTRSIKAMQELDAELQAEKAKVSVLEIQQADGLTKMALLDARIAALENPST